jgi:hypothetical protein
METSSGRTYFMRKSEKTVAQEITSKLTVKINPKRRKKKRRRLVVTCQ